MNKKNVIRLLTSFAGAILISIIFAGPLFAQVGFGQPEQINQNWKFILKDVEQGEQINFDDDRWQVIDLPHD